MTTTHPMPPGIRPTDWDRMSWHQRDRAHRAWVARLETERPAHRPPHPVVVGPFSRLRPDHLPTLPPLGSLRLAIGLIHRAMEDHHEATGSWGDDPTHTRYRHARPIEPTTTDQEAAA